MSTAPFVAKLPVVILISGGGSNMLAIARQALEGKLPVEVRAVVSDRPDAKGVAAAAALGISTAVLEPKAFAERAHFDAALAELVDSYRPGLVILAGFMRILGAAFIERFLGRMLNIHPSLLPKYRGLHTHRRALEAGDAAHGASVHFVTQELDGGPVVLQARVAVKADDTDVTLAARVLQQEHRIFPETVHWFAAGRLNYRDGKAYLDGQELLTPVVVDTTGEIA